ncbi:MAG TPA: response regulator [Methylomirabilota bacterium]|nr:response regulator [Methylomirabilota bacterium]
MRTMLIVDDDPAWRSLYAMEFKPRFRIVEAEDGIEALGVLDRSLPDVIVLDLRLPRLNGLDFLRALERRGLRTPVVVCSGLVSDERGFAVPGVRAAQKTADLRQVRAAVDDALGEAPPAAPTANAAPSGARTQRS